MIILYGSQTGNAQSIAEEIWHKLNNDQIPLLSLNESLNLFENNINIKNEIFLIVTSTTGNGEIPINGEKWWKFVKNRKLDKNYLDKLSYYVLALGDSNYSEFCGAGKKIFKRLKDLNAAPLNDIITIDDVDDDYENKIDYIINLIKN